MLNRLCKSLVPRYSGFCVNILTIDISRFAGGQKRREGTNNFCMQKKHGTGGKEKEKEGMGGVGRLGRGSRGEARKGRGREREYLPL